MKSPNMMSTTGFIPVIAAPTAIPVKPASEIGVSMTRSVPNSCTSPVRTLKGCPASAMSSPQMNTLGSRRISSASASRTASARVSSRVATAVSGIDVLVYLISIGIGSVDGEFHRSIDFGLNLVLDLIERCLVGDALRHQRFRHQRDGVALGLPGLLFLFRSIVLARD